jgi:hypothetical protein
MVAPSILVVEAGVYRGWSATLAEIKCLGEWGLAGYGAARGKCRSRWLQRIAEATGKTKVKKLLPQ